MADHEPPNITPISALEIPDRIRVHALAKMLGVTSKQVMSALVEAGSGARNVQSSVPRAEAEAVAAALGATVHTEDKAADAAPPAAAEPAAVSPEADLFTNIEAPTATVAPANAAEVPLFLQPEIPDVLPPAPAADRTAVAVDSTDPATDSTAGGESAPSPRRRRRRSGGAGAAATVQEQVDATPADAITPDEAGAVEAVSDGSAAAPGGEDEDEAGSTGSRRRRRGRRGRGRGRGDAAGEDGAESTDDAESGTESSDDAASDAQSLDAVASSAVSTDIESNYADADTDNTDTDNTDTDNTDADNTDEDEEGTGSRRRRRRRRRKSGSDTVDESSDDDPPNTVVHEREPRNKQRSRDEVQGISGSTRLEAKRQRRRDGRDAGRRRPPILSEAEFLARREAVDRKMVVRQKALAGQPDLIQVAVLEDGVLVEHFVTSTSSGSIAGNVYLGRVQNVLPSMEAAFIDIGKGRNGVLYAGEVDWDAAGLGGSARKIEQALKPGDQVLVQVSKDPVGHKGARLTTQISLAGRFLVYVPGGSSTGISRKLPDTERKRLKEILREVVPSDAGVIIRTASEGVSAEELARDVTRLQAQWTAISESASKAGSAKGTSPQSLYEEPDLLVKVVRDLFNEDFSSLVIEGDRAWSTVQTYVETVAPDMVERVQRYESASKDVDVFAAYRIDEQLAKALDRKVWLPSGGTLVIDRSEAMTVVDVNTGKFTGEGGNLEETVTRNNLEAAEEIVRQMRLRDIGGMIIVDFIDMVLESNRDLVLRRLTEALGRDRTRHQVSEVTSLGLVQMTRKRMGTGLVEAFSTTCEHCHGRGILIHQFPVEPHSDDSRDGSRGSGKSESSGNSRRRRGGRDKSESRSESDAVAVEGEDSDDDVAARRAHPVALAMVAHHSDGTETVLDTQPVVHAEPVVDAEAVVEPNLPVEPEATQAPEPAPRARRARRVARAAAAPAGESPGTVIVVPASDGHNVTAPATSPSTTTGSASVAVVVAPDRPRRRRSAARPAGPPVDEQA